MGAIHRRARRSHTLTARDRKALIGGAIVAGLAALLLRGIPWGRHAYAAERDALRAQSERLVYMREQVGSAHALEDSGAAVRAGMARLAPLLLAGSSAAAATTELGAQLTIAAERTHVGVRRTDVVDDSTAAGAARRVTLRASLESDTGGLVGLLGALSRVPELVAVDRIQIAAEAPAEPARPELLHSEITVTGWYLPVAAGR